LGSMAPSTPSTPASPSITQSSDSNNSSNSTSKSALSPPTSRLLQRVMEGSGSKPSLRDSLMYRQSVISSGDSRGVDFRSIQEALAATEAAPLSAGSSPSNSRGKAPAQIDVVVVC
jgi:hypothetical protein